MNEEIYNDKLNALFDRWIGAISSNEGISNEEIQFIKDGLMYKNDISIAETDNKWCSLGKRVMFIAKDKNADGSDDTRYWLRDMPFDERKHQIRKFKNRKLQVGFLKRIAYLLWGIHKIDHSMDWWYNEVLMHHDEVTVFFNTCPFAFIESKKQPGGSSIEDSILAKHISTYNSFLQDEIEILSPNYIVCFGNEVFNGVLSICSTHNLTEVVPKKIYEIHASDGELKCTVIHMSHPSNRAGYRKYYEDNMYWIRNYLKNT